MGVGHRRTAQERRGTAAVPRRTEAALRRTEGVPRRNQGALRGIEEGACRYCCAKAELAWNTPARMTDLGPWQRSDLH